MKNEWHIRLVKDIINLLKEEAKEADKANNFVRVLCIESRIKRLESSID